MCRPYGGGPGMTYLSKVFLVKLRKAGLGVEQIAMFTEYNPGCALSLRPLWTWMWPWPSQCAHSGKENKVNCLPVRLLATADERSAISRNTESASGRAFRGRPLLPA